MRIPSYLPNTQPDGTVKARVVIRGKSHGLGAYGSAESRTKYRELLMAAGYKDPGDPCEAASGKLVTIADLVLAWWKHADAYYRRPDGRPKNELGHFRRAAKVLTRLFGELPIADFGPKAMAKIQSALASGDWMNEAERAWLTKRHRPIGLCRQVIRKQLGRLRRIFSWAESQELIPEGKTAALSTLKPLHYGQAREAKKVLPVPEDDLKKTLQHLGGIVHAMVEFQLHTGCRPGEATHAKPGELSPGGRVEIAPGFWLELGKSVWVFRPEWHKNAWRGLPRLILVGPRAQAAIEPLLVNRLPHAFLFSPTESLLDFRHRQRLARKTKVQPSQYDRSQPGKQRSGESYDLPAYNQAIARACKRAAVPKWSCGRLRHNAASRLAAEFGEEVARVILGHSTPATTMAYILRDLQAAVSIIEKVG